MKRTARVSKSNLIDRCVEACPVDANPLQRARFVPLCGDGPRIFLAVTSASSSNIAADLGKFLIFVAFLGSSR